MSQHLTDLSDLDTLLVGAKPAERKKSDPVPNGRYQVFVDKARVDQHEETGNRQLVWEMVVLAGPHRGRRLWYRNTLGTQKNVDWLLHDLQLVGAPLPERMNDLHAIVKHLLDVTLEVNVRNQVVDGHTYTNVYLNRRVALEIPPELRSSDEESLHDFQSTF
ncbi:MAG: DUF669 domain-containing protein [Armatimonadota bacterium]